MFELHERRKTRSTGALDIERTEPRARVPQIEGDLEVVVSARKIHECRLRREQPLLALRDTPCPELRPCERRLDNQTDQPRMHVIFIRRRARRQHGSRARKSLYRFVK